MTHVIHFITYMAAFDYSSQTIDRWLVDFINDTVINIHDTINQRTMSLFSNLVSSRESSSDPDQI